MDHGLSIRRGTKELTMISIEEKYDMIDLYRRGVSISEIARQTGSDRKTVRKVVKGEPVKTKKKSKAKLKRERKIDTYAGYLKQRMSEGVYNTRKLLREIQGRGYTGGLTQLILYVQPYRLQHEEVAVMRFET